MCTNIKNISIGEKLSCKYNENDIDEIVPGLYLGNLESSNNLQILNRHNIKYIIRATLDLGIIYKHIKYLHVPIKDYMVDTLDTDDLFSFTSNYITDNIFKGNILVHCKKGHHRSATIIAAFLYTSLKLPYNTVLQHINNKRYCSLRRDTFMMRGLYKYYLKINNIPFKNIYVCNNDVRYVTYNFS